MSLIVCMFLCVCVCRPCGTVCMRMSARVGRGVKMQRYITHFMSPSAALRKSFSIFGCFSGSSRYVSFSWCSVRRYEQGRSSTPKQGQYLGPRVSANTKVNANSLCQGKEASTQIGEQHCIQTHAPLVLVLTIPLLFELSYGCADA